MINFPTSVPDCDCYSLALLDFFLFSDTSVYSTIAFPPLGNSDLVIVSVSIDFPLNSKWDVPFHHLFLVLIWIFGFIYLFIHVFFIYGWLAANEITVNNKNSYN